MRTLSRISSLPYDFGKFQSRTGDKVPSVPVAVWINKPKMESDLNLSSFIN
jgi:hypothetical protein